AGGQGRQVVGEIHGAVAAVIQQFVEQDRVLGQEGGGPAAGIDHAQHAVQCVRVFGQQRQVGRAARDCLEEIEQAPE
nr:hypothetical protein [Tanacetum cinerariifolium]